MTLSVDYALWREGDFWAVRGGDRAVRLRDSKGLGYLAILVQHPDVDLHALQLAAAVHAAAPGAGRPAAADVADLRGDDASGAGPAIDEQAKRAYRARIDELRADLEEATRWADDERAARAREELEALTDELAHSVGLGGRDRPSASQAERARQNVGRALRKAIERIARAEPELGAHLERAIRMGTYCRYHPHPDRPLALLERPPADGGPGAPGPGLDGPRHNLPLPVSTFVGRERDLGELSALVRGERLVTLTGAGGSGKTRLALEAARPLAAQMAGGAWLVDLAPVFEPELVVKATAQALGVRERPQVPLSDAVVERCRATEMVVVLDNCEHLVDECAALADRLVQFCPDLHLLATSREPLGVPGEIVRRIGPLTVPGSGDALDSVATSESAQLLVDRAQAVLPDFRLTAATAPLVARVCRRLDGLPLAIELAAARVATLSLHDLAAHLDDRFAVLTGGARTALPRQRTLEGTVAWSYGLLSDKQRLLFDRLSVFAGGWLLEAAEDVCALGALTSPEVVDGLGALVDKSLVVRDDLGDGRVRYRLLETLRQYGRERLEARGETAVVRDAHLAWVVRLGERAEAHLHGLEQGVWLDRLEAELDNVRTAIEWALASGDVDSGLRIGSIATGSFWLWRGHVGEGSRALGRLLDGAASASPEARARGSLAAGRIAFQTGRWEDGARHCRASRRLWRVAGDAAGEARALIWLAMNEWSVASPEAVGRLVDESVAAAARAGTSFEHALACGLAAVWWADHDLPRAVALADQAGRLIEAVPSPNWLAHVSEFRAYVAFVAGDHDSARTLLADALPLYAQIANRSCAAHGLETAALVTAAVGQADAAAELLGAAERLRGELGTAPPAYEAFVRRRGVEAIEACLDERAIAVARERGCRLGFHEAVQRAQAVVG